MLLITGNADLNRRRGGRLARLPLRSSGCAPAAAVSARTGMRLEGPHGTHLVREALVVEVLVASGEVVRPGAERIGRGRAPVAGIHKTTDHALAEVQLVQLILAGQLPVGVAATVAGARQTCRRARGDRSLHGTDHRRGGGSTEECRRRCAGGLEEAALPPDPCALIGFGGDQPVRHVCIVAEVSGSQDVGDDAALVAIADRESGGRHGENDGAGAEGGPCAGLPRCEGSGIEGPRWRRAGVRSRGAPDMQHRQRPRGPP